MPEIKCITHLKNDSYYNDLYDCHTVDICRRHEEKFSKKSPVAGVSLIFMAGERYAKKSDTVRKWANEDKRKDEKLDKAVPQSVIQCLYCRTKMNCTTKDLQGNGKDEKVLFFYNCPKCQKNRAFYDDGREYRPIINHCPKCQGVMESTSSKEGNSITTILSCPGCGHNETDVFDLSEKKEKIDENFIKDRERFCLSEEVGRKYIMGVMNLERASKLLEEDKKADKGEAVSYITIARVDEILTKALEGAGYSNFKLGSPELGKDVVVDFTAQDKRVDRQEYDSRHGLRKLIDKTLAGTNWKLMSDGVNYRVGVLSGRIKGVEVKAY